MSEFDDPSQQAGKTVDQVPAQAQVASKDHPRSLTLSSPESEGYRKQLEDRHNLLTQATEQLAKIPETKDPLTLAATDIYVKNAQDHLTTRARWLIGSGIALSLLTITLLVLLAYHISVLTVPEKLEALPFTLLLIKAISFTGVGLAAAYFLGALARAFLHEGIAAFQRRHALRFGQLYVYVRRGSITYTELSDAFQWHEPAETAFRDIKLEALTRTLLHQLIDAAGGAVKAVFEGKPVKNDSKP